MSNSLIAGLQRKLTRPTREHEANKTRVVVSPVRIGLTAANLPIPAIPAYTLTPFIECYIKLRGYGPSGVAISEFNVDQFHKTGKTKHFQPGAYIDQLTGAFRAQGLVNIDVLVDFDSAADGWDELRRLQDVCFPESLGIYDPARQDNLFNRISDHLAGVIEQYGPDSVEGRVAAACREANELGRTRRVNFFRELQRESINGRVPIGTIEAKWRRQLSIELPEGMILAGAVPGDSDYMKSNGGLSPAAEAALIRIAEQGAKEQPLPANVEALIDAKAEQMFQAFLAKQEANAAATTPKATKAKPEAK